ncbi:hypothetical protein PINS_up000631 [Pythium insidiosum]|nr:hypothetical protein PINS_up000631 [Pythium insidiosum]
MLLLALPLLQQQVDAKVTSTVYFRKTTNGSIFALDNRDGSEQELSGTQSDARLVALAIDTPFAPATGAAGVEAARPRLWWSDGRAIRSARLDGSNVRTELGAIVRVRWRGANFGSSRADLLDLLVKNTRCVSVTQWTPNVVECLVGLPDRFPVDDQAARLFVTPNDCVIRTTRGEMTGVAQSYAEMLATGYPSPVVQAIDIDAAFVLPQAMTIPRPPISADAALYWFNAADGRIYRSSLTDSAINVVQDRVWGVRGLVVLDSAPFSSPSGSLTRALYYSVEPKGEIRRVTWTPGVWPRLDAAADIVLSGLSSPRGLAIDPGTTFLYYTEKTGRLYRVPVAVMQSGSLSLTGPTPQLLITLSTMTRLDGLAVDSK